MGSGRDQQAYTANRKAILRNPAYRLAYEDAEFLAGPDMRSMRLQMELLKPEKALERHGIASTVVVFGSARIPSPEQAARDSQPPSARGKLSPSQATPSAHYYEEARNFARKISARFQHEGRCDFVVVTGGGPGIMEAANRGAFDAGMRSIGLNITLPNEQYPNSYITPDLAFRFRYFAIRKMHFLLRARGLVVFPGGFGTFDEFFELLTLIQTGKMKRIPIVLFGKDFWTRVVNFEAIAEEGTINHSDLDLIHWCETAEEAWCHISEFYELEC